MELYISIGVGVMTILVAIFGYTKIKKFDFIFKVIATLMPSIKTFVASTSNKYDDKALAVLDGLLKKYGENELEKTKKEVDKMTWEDLKKGTEEEVKQEDDDDEDDD